MCHTPIVCTVDDDPQVRRLVDRLVDDLGLVSRHFASADKFLDLCQTDPPDCLITDVEMPEMSGLQLFATLRKQGFEFPIIVLSGRCAPDDIENALAIGVSDFVCKPFRVTRLCQSIERALNRDQN